MDLLLKGLHWSNANGTIQGDLRIRKGLIIEIGESLHPGGSDQTIHFDNHFVYPGLINSHDHLEMNLYPRLGHPPYENYMQWGHDIYKPHESPLREIEKIDINDRLQWGGLKNLLSGVTTVVHHNPWKRILESRNFPVKVLKNFAWSHSLGFGKNIQNDFPKNQDKPFVIHAAEGLDAMAFDEIIKLDELGVLKKNTVIVHAIALRQKEIDILASRQCAIVWCPESNLFLFRKTAKIDILKKNIRTALGSDSTLTGSPTLLDEMRCARQTGLASPREIFDMVSTIPAQIFGLPKPQFSPGAIADLMITPILHRDYFENLQIVTPSNIEAIFLNGAPVYVDEKFAGPLPLKYQLKVNGIKKRTRLDFGSLRDRLKKKLGTEILESNAIWKQVDS